MRRKKIRHPLQVMAVLLVIALLAVSGVMIYKQHEYEAGENYYDGLREITEAETP